MPFYRCMPPAGSGGGGGGGGDSSYAVQIDLGNNEYFNFPYILINKMPFNTTSFNSPIRIGKDVICLNGFLSGVKNFNAPVVFETPDDDYNYYKNTYETIANGFNLTILATTLAFEGNGVNMFSACSNFNQPVVLDNRFKNTVTMFGSCLAFNHPVKIPKSVNNATSMFASCASFNSVVDFSDCDSRNGGDLNRMGGIFTNCQNFNQPVNFPLFPSFPISSATGALNVAQYGSMFYNCCNFNSRINVKVKNGFTGDFNTFMKNCINYNIPLYIDASESDRAFFNDAFTGMCNFRQPILIELNPAGYSFTALNMFNRLTASTPMNHNRPTDIIIHNFNNSLGNSPNTWFRNMLIGCSERTNQRINIYIPVLSYLTNANNAYGFLGKGVAWTAMTNGLYNTAYNVYLYNNTQDGANQFWDYYNNFYNIS